MHTAEKMDAQYRYQRYVYDLSRKYYLLGRDAILDDIALGPQQTLLEVGCGTGRNLRKLAARYPQNALYGIDAASVMLDTAQRQMDKHPNVTLRQALAQQVTPATLDKETGFDHILFSYVLSMIPDWPHAIEQALCNLKPGGTLHVVDFSDQRNMPAWCQRILLTWLDWFHVHPDPQVPAYLESLSARHGGTLELRQIASHYALVAHFHKNVT